MVLGGRKMILSGAAENWLVPLPASTVRGAERKTLPWWLPWPGDTAHLMLYLWLSDQPFLADRRGPWSPPRPLLPDPAVSASLCVPCPRPASGKQELTKTKEQA